MSLSYQHSLTKNKSAAQRNIPMRISTKVVTLHLWTLWISHNHCIEHVMKMYTASFRSVQHGSCKMLKTVQRQSHSFMNGI